MELVALSVAVLAFAAYREWAGRSERRQILELCERIAEHYSAEIHHLADRIQAPAETVARSFANGDEEATIELKAGDAGPWTVPPEEE